MDNNIHIAAVLFLSFSLLFVSGCNKEEAEFIEALKSENWQEAQKFLTRHPNYINGRNPKTGATLLHSAVYYENTEMVEFLLNNGADFNILRSKAPRRTPLQAAAATSCYEITLIFLQKRRNLRGQTPYFSKPV